MVILRFRTDSDAKELLRKLKKMHKFTKELMDCVEDKYEEDDEEYREDEDDEPMRSRSSYRTRYRRGM